MCKHSCSSCPADSLITVLPPTNTAPVKPAVLAHGVVCGYQVKQVGFPQAQCVIKMAWNGNGQKRPTVDSGVVLERAIIQG